MLLAIKSMGGEGEAAWRALLDDLVRRGLRTPALVVIDGAPGLEKAVAAHAKQFKRANRALRTIRTYLGRVIRDIGCKIRGEKALEALFAHELTLARRRATHDQRH